MSNTFCFAYSLNQWYLRAMCLVLGVNFSHFAMLIHAILSSYTLHLKLGGKHSTSGNTQLNSFNKWINGRSYLRAWLITTYSASAELKQISVCRWDFQIMGQLLYLNMYPVLDKQFLGWSWSTLFQFPAKSASTYSSRPFFKSGMNTIPLYLVETRYLLILITAFSCVKNWVAAIPRSLVHSHYYVWSLDPDR